ncbi:hypothetical protein EVAR_76929_1 [Eumeta japonica]|uniref:Uncharacterized protein n=1 Tax=Eumeta variegata TaxID=151549 RepID=A0A4C1SEU1_EUMVA|nr:hypothetical protein EVAR_76929_1 [Eumeta japonica]
MSSSICISKAVSWTLLRTTNADRSLPASAPPEVVGALALSGRVNAEYGRDDAGARDFETVKRNGNNRRTWTRSPLMVHHFKVLTYAGKIALEASGDRTAIGHGDRGISGERNDDEF